MNKDWSEKNKKMQTLIGKEATFREGIRMLIELRSDLFGQITSIVKNYPPEAFYQMPFAGAEGYHGGSHGLHDQRLPDPDCGLEKGRRIP